MTDNYFKQLNQIDCSAHVEKKGRFSYLSWPWAVKTLKDNFPGATWEVMRFEGMPFMNTDCGYFVEVAVTVGDVTHSQIHPVLDNYNKPIVTPTAFDINTSIARCLVKAIALHGLGLYIYAGEDLPDTTKETVKMDNKQVKDFVEQCQSCLSNGDAMGLKELWAEFDSDEKVILWGKFNSQERTAMKQLMKD